MFCTPVDADARAWLERAEEDLDTARFNHGGGRFPIAAFLAQQAAEKVLKALLISRGQPLRKIHDLVVLGRALSAPRAVEDACDLLNPHYIEARYPTGLVDKYEDDDAREAIDAAAEVVAWARSLL